MKNIKENSTKLKIENIEKILYTLNMSVRQIKKSYISCTGYFASYKNKSQIAFESVLERDFYMILEFNNNVVSYEEQPLSIQYDYIDGNKRRYTPDTLVTYKNNLQILYEVKYANEIRNNEKLQEKIAYLKKYLSEKYQLDFEIFTDEDINKDYLENLKFLYKYAFMPENKKISIQINTILNNEKSINITQLLQRLEPDIQKQPYMLPNIWKYTFLNSNVLNLYNKLNMNSILHKGLYDGFN